MSLPVHWVIDVLCRSEYLIKGILCLQTNEDYTYDMCDNGQCPHVYGRQLKKSARLARSGERCPNCGNLRYRKKNKQVYPVRR